MLEINGNNIKLTRGDTALINLVIYASPSDCCVNSTALENIKNQENRKVYELQDGDSVYFAVRKFPKTGRYRDCMIEKQFELDDDGNLNLSLEGNETAYFEYGRYYYDCTLYFANGEENTVLKGSFTLTSEIG